MLDLMHDAGEFRAACGLRLSFAFNDLHQRRQRPLTRRPLAFELPHGLRHHELPHWPTEMSIAEIELTRTPFGKGGVERGEARA